MRTRAQIQAWQDATAQHRAATTPPPRAAQDVTEAKDTPALETPVRKRKRASAHSNVSESGRVNISPATRSARKRGRPSTPKKTSCESKTMILATRRALAYSTSDQGADKRIEDEKATEEAVTQEESVTMTPEAVLQRICSGIAVSTSAPTVAVVGRLEQRTQLRRVFLGEKAQASPDSPEPRALFLIGPPGTGKTSCVAAAASTAAADGSEASRMVRVNCSTFRDPRALLAAVGVQLRAHSSCRLPVLDASALDAFLQRARRASSSSSSFSSAKITVLVLDELDNLLRLPVALRAHVQLLLRFLVRWAHLPHSRVRVLGLLNGMDLLPTLEALDGGRVLLFPSYDHDQLAAILRNYVDAAMGSNSSSAMATSTSRPALHDVVDSRALELVARKIAARDGDARRAIGLLQQCARSCLAQEAATTTATSASPQCIRAPLKLSLRDVLRCSQSALTSTGSVMQQIERLPRLPKLVLLVIAALAPGDASDAFTHVDALRVELVALSQQHSELAWIPRFRPEELLQHIGVLDCYALIKQRQGGRSRRLEFCATVSRSTLQRACQDDELLRVLLVDGKRHD